MSKSTPIKLLATCLLMVLIATVSLAGQVRADGLRQDALKIPAVIAGGSGAVELEAIVVRPDDGQPHPLAIINHGSPRLPEQRPKMSPYGMWAQAVAFARRGWVAVAFLRRGYGESGGAWAENYGSCANPDYASAGRAGASDIAAVARYMRAQPYVSKARWISVGGSAGAFATLALTADAPPDLAAAISFAPGRGSQSPDTVCGENRLIAALADYGRTSRIPVLWVSAENDHFFGPRLVARLTAAFTRAGGNLTYVATPPFADDGHKLFSVADGMPIWSPIVDQFLQANKLTLRDGLIDVPLPNVAAPPNLSSRGRETFRTYLESGPNKAFAVAADAHFGWATGRRTTDQARKDALEFCAASAPAGCRIVNVNNAAAE
jgi:dienelactone hydrolase